MSRRSSVERAMQRAHGLPDGRSQDDGWRDGANGTRYLRVELQGAATPVDKSDASLYLRGDGSVVRNIRVGDDEVFAEPLSRSGLR